MPSFFDERILTTLQALADSNDTLITLINHFVDITQVRNIPPSQLPGHYTHQEEMNLNGQVQSLRFKINSREDYVCFNFLKDANTWKVLGLVRPTYLWTEAGINEANNL